MDIDRMDLTERYADEARGRYGDTDAYKEYERRAADFKDEDRKALSDGMDEIMRGFARLKNEGAAPSDEQARLQVEKLRQFITERMYNCTDEILAGLGQMYAGDERFTANIDRHGAGTAAYISECIKEFFS